MSSDYDVIVVGARTAGASLALLLARHGHRVLLVDKARFPSEIRHGHLIHREGPARLARWGVLDVLLKTGCPPLTSVTMNLGGCAIVARDLEVQGVAWGYAPRRGPFDQLLVEAAVARGADFREGFAVDGTLGGSEAVVGVRGRSLGAARSVDVRAKLVVGADGRHSVIARHVKAACHESAPALTCWYFSYWEGVPDRALEVHMLEDPCAIYALPTHAGLYGIFVGWPIAEFGRVKADIEGSMSRALERVPSLGERLRSGARAERFYGTRDVPNFLRSAYGPGWALLGDAGCHKDPVQALGMNDALRDAEFLADAVHEGLSGGRPLADALSRYERRRNDATLADFHANVQAARFEPPGPALTQLRRLLRDDAAAARHFFLQHLVDPVKGSLADSNALSGTVGYRALSKR